MKSRFWIVFLSLLMGFLIRYAFRDYSTPDAFGFLLPWFNFAREHGLQSLQTTFTNYTPFYSYLLIVAAKFDGFAPPLLLVKSISFAFDLGNAVLAYRLVYFATQSDTRSTTAFALTWLAPTVLFNSALWGQADAIWTFFVMLSIYLFSCAKQGTPPFGMAFAVKAQGAFLGPFVLGFLLQERRRWLWLVSVPTVYIILALPVVAAGVSLQKVLTVYLTQAETFHKLALNVANLWMFVPNDYYRAGVLCGLVLASVSGLALAIFIARSKRSTPEFLMLAACVSLLLMPFLLPKMHERYFYAFEVASISLACINPGYGAVALIAQISGVLSYLPYDRGIVRGLPLAALLNTVLVVFLLQRLRTKERRSRFVLSHYRQFIALIIAFVSFLAYTRYREITIAESVVYFIFYVALPVQAYSLLRRAVDPR